MICIPSIDPSSMFYTGPFNPGTKQLLTHFGINNIGIQDLCLFFVKFVEYPGMSNEKPLGGTWSKLVSPGETIWIDFKWDIPSGITSWNVGVKVWWQDEKEPAWGHANTRQWDIQVRVLCIDGEEEVIDYCPDGYTPKRKRICENGKWVYYDYECVECTEGAEDVVDYCPDGYTPKRKRICENGKWVYYDFTCPECNEGEEEILEYCEYGEGVKRKRVCENGKWVEYTYVCPGERGWLMEKVQGFVSRFL